MAEVFPNQAPYAKLAQQNAVPIDQSIVIAFCEDWIS